MITETEIRLGDYIVKVKKEPDQSGLKNVISHTYYLCDREKHGAFNQPEKQRQNNICTT